MAKRHPQFSQVLVCQFRQDAKTNVILGKALSVLPETELFEPVRNRLHRGRPADLSWRTGATGPADREFYSFDLGPSVNGCGPLRHSEGRNRPGTSAAVSASLPGSFSDWATNIPKRRIRSGC